jgi:hypothetical protein
MIPKECLEMTVKEYRKWQKENIRCDKCTWWKLEPSSNRSKDPWGYCARRECDVWHAEEFCSRFEAKK